MFSAGIQTQTVGGFFGEVQVVWMVHLNRHEPEHVTLDPHLVKGTSGLATDPSPAIVKMLFRPN